MNLKTYFTGLMSALIIMSFAVFLSGCDKNELQDNSYEQKITAKSLDIGWDALIKNATITSTTVTPRSHGYLAEAKGKGIIPSGEYAGQKFLITMSGAYTDIGLGTLDTGRVTVKIRGELFQSFQDPILQSFCCGEGHLIIQEGEYIFSMSGQLIHTGDEPPHIHLFNGLASTAGFMNMNIADQTGSAVDPADPPHDPGIGAVFGFDALYVRVNLH